MADSISAWSKAGQLKGSASRAARPTKSAPIARLHPSAAVLTTARRIDVRPGSRARRL